MKKFTKALSVFVAVLIGVIMPLFGSLNASAKTCTPASYACAQTSAKQSEKKTCSKFTNAVKKSAAIIAAPFVSLVTSVGCVITSLLTAIDGIRDCDSLDFFSLYDLPDLIKRILHTQIYDAREVIVITLLQLNLL